MSKQTEKPSGLRAVKFQFLSLVSNITDNSFFVTLFILLIVDLSTGLLLAQPAETSNSVKVTGIPDAASISHVFCL